MDASVVMNYKTGDLELFKINFRLSTLRLALTNIPKIICGILRLIVLSKKYIKSNQIIFIFYQCLLNSFVRNCSGTTVYFTDINQESIFLNFQTIYKYYFVP